MFPLYAQLSKAVDTFNESRIEDEQIEYYEVLDMIQDRQSEKELMQLIIKFYSESY